MSKRRRAIGALYGTLGCLALIAAWTIGEAPSAPVGWAVLASLAAAFAVMSFRSVEYNDRMLVSASVMVVFSAGIVFSLLPLGGDAPIGAALPMTLVAASGFLSAQDVRSRDTFLPIVNLGQMAVSGLAAGLVLDAAFSPGIWKALGDALPFLSLPEGVSVVGTGRTVTGGGAVGELVVIVVAGAVAAVVYGLVNLLLVRLAVVLIYGARRLQPWSQIPYLLSVELLQGVMGAMLGALLVASPSASFIPLVMIVYVTGQMVFTSYSALRAAHENTLRGFVKALEAQDLYTRGHTERVAEFVRRIGDELGFSGNRLERMRWAALVHDVGKLAVPSRIIRKQGRLSDEEYRRLRVATHRVDDILAEVSFLQPMVQICSGVHPRLAGEDFGQIHHTHSTVPDLEQSVLAVADAFDALTSTRSHRMALSQAAALEVLERSDDPLFSPQVVAALRSSLARVGDVYGPPGAVEERGMIGV